MKHLKLFLAFVSGWATVITLGIGIDALAQRGTGGTGGPTSLQSRISALQERVKKLEQANVFGKLPKKFVAPFEIVDRAGGRIFYVSPDRDVEFYRAGKRTAVMSAGGDIGTFWVLTADSGSWATLTGERLAITEKGHARMELGRGSDQGNYRLKFISGEGKDVAGIGEGPDTHSGVVIVYDKSGLVKARMGVIDNSGAMGIVGTNQKPIAVLTEARGGYLMICSANGCDPPMVEAGDLGGYGVVRTGPMGYNPGVGLMGVPGSFVEGKH